MCKHYPNVNALAKQESGGNATHEKQLIDYANSCAIPAYDYFEEKFDAQTGDLKVAVQAFKAARYFSPMQLNELKPTPNDIDSLNIFPFVGATVIGQLKEELPTYLAATDEISPDVVTIDWWKAHENELPTWSRVCKMIALVCCGRASFFSTTKLFL